MRTILVSFLSLLLLTFFLHPSNGSAPTFEFYPKAYAESPVGREANMHTQWNNLMDHAARVMEQGSYHATHIAKITLPVGHQTLPLGGEIFRLASQNKDGSWSLDLSPDVLNYAPTGEPFAVRIKNTKNYKDRLTSMTDGNPPYPGEEVLFTHPGKGAIPKVDSVTVKSSVTGKTEDVNIEHFSGIVPSSNPEGRVTVGWVLKATNSLGGNAISKSSGRAQVISDKSGIKGYATGPDWQAEVVGIQFRGGHSMKPSKLTYHTTQSFENQKIDAPNVAVKAYKWLKSSKADSM